MSQSRFAGVDWALEEHAVCVVDERGRIVEGRRYRHDERGIRALCARLLQLRVQLVALERPDGLLIERLLEAGLVVVAVHPNQVVAMRPRFSVAGGKSDSFDAFVLAELARTDSHRFRILVPDSDRTKALRALTRAREDLVRTRIALANQLREQLACFWPGATQMFYAIDTPIALAFLRRYPSPVDARGLGGRAITACARRSTASRTRADATTPGLQTSTTAPGPGALATNTQPGFLAAPGAKSSGASGTTTTPTSPTGTPPANASSPPPQPETVGTHRVPTSPQPSDGRRRRHRRLPKGQSAQRLTPSPADATHAP